MSQGLVAPCMWDLPRSGIEPMSPALEGRFFTTELPEKPLIGFLQEVFAGGLPSLFTVLAISVFYVWLVLAALGLCCCSWASYSCGKWGATFVGRTGFSL